jgi:DNA repair protein RecN (Recombination protein N)
VASGGEISRFMLAVKHLLSVKRQLPTIIFDEIDTGVSGEIADKMGNIFKEMSGHMQVINITHLPQVAAKADTHILVYKEEGAELVQTRVVPLSKEQRTKEIAKMLSGSQITPEALNNAKVLLDL